MIVGVIGGGAAGMMSAITAARNGHKVTIIEHGQRVGKKILATGNGRCNYTNVDISLKHFHGGKNKDVISAVLKTFDQKKTIRFFDEIGVFPKEKNGCIYPYSEQASALLDCLRNEIIRLNIDVVIECNTKEISKITDIDAKKIVKQAGEKEVEFAQGDVFRVTTDKGVFLFDKLIIAAGSQASEKTGSDGSGYKLAKALGHTIRKPLPALCSLKCQGDYFKSIAGIRCSANVKLLVDGQDKKEDRGELQLTDYGISGIPVFQVSYIAARALNKGLLVEAEIDFMPDCDSLDDLYDIITSRIKNNPDKTMDEVLIGVLHKNLCILFNKEAGINQKMPCGEAKGTQINTLCRTIKKFKVKVTDTNTFDNAQVCSGGIRLEEVTENLQSTKIRGLYFAGEILDVNGDCGGYNLQFAWSSGYVAGCLN